ncbi:MAG TPA: hypothetical protein VM689_13500 [Aliidongia sp.]|nr:hypothetical protein [Aliidongia sp.]
MPEIRDASNPMSPAHTASVQAVWDLAEQLRPVHGDNAVLSALITVYLNGSLALGRGTAVRRMLELVLRELPELEAGFAAKGLMTQPAAGRA